MNLAFQELGQGEPLIIMHGLFGSSDNWLSIAKVLAQKRKVFLLDLRNHGDSPHSEAFSYDLMVDDLILFLENHNIKDPIILGHSMGGKAAMNFAVNNPDDLSKLIIVDIGPKAYPVHHKTILEGLMSINVENVTSRAEAETQLAAYVHEKGIRQFLLKNLGRNEDGKFYWKINLPVIDREIGMIGEALNHDHKFVKPTLFIHGQQSNYILDEDKEEIKDIFPFAKIESIPNAGHWVHAEQPQAFIEIVEKFLG